MSVDIEALRKVQYMHFTSPLPLGVKPNLIRCLANRAKIICKENTVEAELQSMRKVFNESRLTYNVMQTEGKFFGKMVVKGTPV